MILWLYWIIFSVGLAGTALLTVRDAVWPPEIPLAWGVVLAWLTCFGGAGILALQLFWLHPRQSILAALLFACLSAGAFGILGRLVRQLLARQRTLVNLIGVLGTVVSTIEPGRAGLITTQKTPEPLTLAATAAQECAVAIGTTVIITGIQQPGSAPTVEVALLPAVSQAAIARSQPPSSGDA